MRTIYPALPGGHFKVLTMSFDDGRLEDRRLVGLFNEYGIRGTFNLNSGVQDGRRIPQSEYATLYRGHEIAAHGVTHANVTATPLSQAVQQILEDRRALERLTGVPVRGFAYPFGDSSAQITALLPSLGIRYARTVQDTGKFSLPEDFLLWNPTCHFRSRMREYGAEFLARTGLRKPVLLYVWGHSYELAEGNNWVLMEEFCRMLGRREDIWYATNLEIYDYLQAFARLEFTADADRVYNPSAAEVWLCAGDALYRVPGGQTVELG